MSGEGSTADVLALARWQASKRLPYLARAMWSIMFVETDAVPTMAVDKYFRVYVNPKHIAECRAESDDAVIFGVLHEVMHPTMKHASRGETIKAQDPAWNVAGDFEINERLVQAGCKPWSKDLRAPKGSEELTAEEHYAKLPKQGGGSGGKGTGGGGGKCKCGGGTGVDKNADAPWELGPPNAENPGVDEARAEIVRMQVAAAVKEHAEQKGRGSVPAGLLRWAEEFGTPPPVDWKKLVGAKVAYALAARRGPSPSFARPSRRNAGRLVLPVYRQPVPNVALVIDTSGSMGDADIGVGLAATFDACEALGKVSVVACDAAATEPVECRCLDDLKPYLAGGGGTDMGVGLAKADEIHPDAIVIVTDGDTPWPQKAPDAPVVVVLTREPYSPPPAWADVIRVSDEDGGKRRR